MLKKKSKKILSVFFINFLLTLLVVIVAELIFGNWIFGPKYSVLNIPRNENRYFDVSNVMGLANDILYTRDKHGLRGTYGDDPKSIDILVIGGSTTDEQFIDNPATWVQQLEKQFQDNGNNLTFVNAGIDGQSTRGHALAFELWFPNIPNLRPKYVIAYIGINDTTLGPERSLYDSMKSDQFFRRARYFIMNHSALYNQFRRIRGMLRAHRAQVIHGTTGMANGKWLPVNEMVDIDILRKSISLELKAYKNRLLKLISLIKAYGATPIFVTQTRGDFRFYKARLFSWIPSNQDNPHNITSFNFHKLKLFNQVTLSVCRAIQISCINLGEEIKFTDGDFYDSIHTTPSGSYKIATFLYDKLRLMVNKNHSPELKKE